MNRPLTTAEVAAQLGIKPVTVTWRVREGKMTPLCQLPGGAYLFDPDTITELKEQANHE